MKRKVNKTTLAAILHYVFHPALYIFSGAVCAIVFIFFDSSLLWVALLIALMAAPVYYGRKVFQAIRDMKWESRWLEEDFIA